MKWLIVSLATGLAIWASLPPFDLSFLAWFALIPILTLIRLSPQRSVVFLASFVSAFIPIAGIAYSLISFSAPFYFFIILSLPFGFGLLALFYKASADLFKDNIIVRILIVPVLWTLFEFALTESPLSLPLNFAISQASHPLWIQLAALGGIYLVSFFILLINTLLAEVWILSQAGLRIRAAVCLVIASAIFLAVSIHGHREISSPLMPEKTLRMASVQPVISSEDYRDHWVDPAVRGRVRVLFEKMTEDAVSKKPLDLVVWPEGGNGYYNFRIPEFRQRMSQLAIQSKTSILASSLDLDEEGNRFNSVFSIGTKGELIDRYDKVRLTPIGEETLTAGSELRPIQTRFGPVGVLVCFESSFSSLARKLKNLGAQLLFITTSDAPFRNSAFPLLHASMAIFRAVENGVTVLRSANTGPSMVVDPMGQLVAHTQFYERGIMEAFVPLYRRNTTYAVYGNGWLVLPGLFFFT